MKSEFEDKRPFPLMDLILLECVSPFFKFRDSSLPRTPLRSANVQRVLNSLLRLFCPWLFSPKPKFLPPPFSLVWTASDHKTNYNPPAGICIQALCQSVTSKVMNCPEFLPLTFHCQGGVLVVVQSSFQLTVIKPPWSPCTFTPPVHPTRCNAYLTLILLSLSVLLVLIPHPSFSNYLFDAFPHLPSGYVLVYMSIQCNL